MIGLTKLQGFYLKLDGDFKHALLTNARRKLKTWVEVARQLKITDSTLCSIRNMKNGREVWIKAEHLLKLSKITGFSIENIERNVLALRKQTGHACVLELPIKYSPSLAELIGYSLGDGHIGKNPTAFVYTSKNLSTINYVKDLVRETLGTRIFYRRYKECRGDVYFPYIVGELLLKFGSVSGSKTDKSFSVPSWIMQGSEEIKRAFLRALFEDEGSVSIHRDTKGIVLALWKCCVA